MCSAIRGSQRGHSLLEVIVSCNTLVSGEINVWNRIFINGPATTNSLLDCRYAGQSRRSAERRKQGRPGGAYSTPEDAQKLHQEGAEGVRQEDCKKEGEAIRCNGVIRAYYSEDRPGMLCAACMPKTSYFAFSCVCDKSACVREYRLTEVACIVRVEFTHLVLHSHR